MSKKKGKAESEGAAAQAPHPPPSVGPIPVPLYRSHKLVRAFKIGAIGFAGDLAAVGGAEHEGSSILTPENPRILPVTVSSAYIRKHQPQVGGYYVRYDDGYESWSPASAFEEGYTLVAEAPTDDSPAF